MHFRISAGVQRPLAGGGHRGQLCVSHVCHLSRVSDCHRGGRSCASRVLLTRAGPGFLRRWEGSSVLPSPAVCCPGIKKQQESKDILEAIKGVMSMLTQRRSLWEEISASDAFNPWTRNDRDGLSRNSPSQIHLTSLHQPHLLGNMGWPSLSPACHLILDINWVFIKAACQY